MIWLLTAVVAYLGWVTHRQERRIDSLYVVKMVQQDIICKHKERLDALEDTPCACGHPFDDHQEYQGRNGCFHHIGGGECCSCNQFVKGDKG